MDSSGRVRSGRLDWNKFNGFLHWLNLLYNFYGWTPSYRNEGFLLLYIKMCLRSRNLTNRWPGPQFLQPALLSSIVAWPLTWCSHSSLVSRHNLDFKQGEIQVPSCSTLGDGITLPLSSSLWIQVPPLIIGFCPDSLCLSLFSKIPVHMTFRCGLELLCFCSITESQGLPEVTWSRSMISNLLR